MAMEWFPVCANIGLVCIELISSDEEAEIMNPRSICFDDASGILFIEDEDNDTYGFSKGDIIRIAFIKKRNVDNYKKRKGQMKDDQYNTLRE